MDALDIYDKIKLEKDRVDKSFKKVEFNLKEDIIIMNTVYDDVQTTEDNHHTFPHDLDPEVLNEDTYKQLKEILNDKEISYVIRRDDFI